MTPSSTNGKGLFLFLECHLPVPVRLELLEQHRRVVADARVRERGELVRIGAAEERVHPFPHPGAARDAQLERDPAQHLVFVAGEHDIEPASKVD